MASNVWSGHLTFGLVSLPVSLTVAARPESVHFNQLHKAKDGSYSRIKQKLFSEKDNVEVAREQIVKGYEFEKGQYVVLNDSELKAAEPDTSASMEILEFVKISDIDPVFMEKSYYLRPDDAGAQVYALLFRALKETKYAGVAKVAMHNREHIVIVRPGDRGLVLHTMFYRDEVREMDEFASDTKVSKAQLDMAKRLIEENAGSFKPEKYSDTYRDNLGKVIAAKVEGTVVTNSGTRKRIAPVIDIMDALQKSLKKKPAAAGEPKAKVEASGA